MTTPKTIVGRVPELDLMRFLAASSVVVYHFTYRPTMHGVPDAQVFGALQSATRFGYLGVNVFFMLSGFVILWSSQDRTASEFVISRFARLFPSYWVCVLLTTTVVLLLGDPQPITGRQVAFNLTMVPPLFGVSYVDGVYWTLFVELKFYLLVFGVLLTRSMRHVERWIAAWLACCLADRLGFAPGWLASLAMGSFGPYFISGCLLYLIRARGPSVVRMLALGLSGTLATMDAIAQQTGFLHQITLGSGVVVATVIASAHLAFLAVALLPRVLPPSRFWYLLGSLTYPLYLLHARIGKAIWATLQDRLSPWVALAVILSIVFALAALIASVTERRACKALQHALMRLFRVRSSELAAGS